MLEYWVKEKRAQSFHFGYPSFHYSNIPWVLFGGPLLQPLIVAGAADPVPGLFVVEEWDTPAVAFVTLPHEFGIGLIMPDLELINL